MTKVYNWRAARSGASITITGQDLNGQPVKITDVRLIEVDLGRCIAHRKAGDPVRLEV